MGFDTEWATSSLEKLGEMSANLLLELHSHSRDNDKEFWDEKVAKLEVHLIGLCASVESDVLASGLREEVDHCHERIKELEKLVAGGEGVSARAVCLLNSVWQGLTDWWRTQGGLVSSPSVMFRSDGLYLRGNLGFCAVTSKGLPGDFLALVDFVRRDKVPAVGEIVIVDSPRTIAAVHGLLRNRWLSGSDRVFTDIRITSKTSYATGLTSDDLPVFQLTELAVVAKLA